MQQCYLPAGYLLSGCRLSRMAALHTQTKTLKKQHTIYKKFMHDNAVVNFFLRHRCIIYLDETYFLTCGVIVSLPDWPICYP